MAEVLRALKPNEAGTYMPLRELHDQSRGEVYEAVGEQLMMIYELTEELIGGDFLVKLSEGQMVGFSYGLCQAEVQ